MKLEKQASFWAYREAIGRAMYGGAGFRAAEPEGEYLATAGPLPLDERLIQAVWAHQFLSAENMRLADGRRVSVLDPGCWSGAAGPDFKSARLLIDGTAVEGDVEIHIEPGDWEAHGHRRDLDYNRVVLHAVLRNPGGGARDLLHNGDSIPRLELEPYVFPDLETLRRSLTADDFEYAQPSNAGLCQPLMTQIDGGVLTDFLDHAGRERLLAKTARLEAQAGQADLEQVFHQSLLSSLGSGAGKTLYYLLAKRAPLAELTDYAGELPREEWPAAIEALLLATAGLLPAPDALEGAPDESRERARRLHELWKGFAPFWSDRVIPPTKRWHQGIRPPNFPARRLAAVAILTTRAMQEGRSLFQDLLERLRAGAPTLEGAAPSRKKHPLLVALTKRLTVEGEGSFWRDHYSFTAKPAPRAMDLIGEGAALGLVVNAFLPAALLAGRKAEDAKLIDAAARLFALAPPLQANHITQFMLRRLFGTEEGAGALVNTEQRRQGLFQIFYHCCHGEARHCEACHYLGER